VADFTRTTSTARNRDSATSGRWVRAGGGRKALSGSHGLPRSPARSSEQRRVIVSTPGAIARLLSEYGLVLTSHAAFRP
jgi:hypothetical protein